MSKCNRCDKWKHITVFDRTYTPDVLAEGLAVNEAVVLGECNRCPFLDRCSSDDNFSPPAFAWCYRRKRELLDARRRREKKEWNL